MIYDAFGKLVAEYGGTAPQDEGGVKYYLQDWQGSVRAGVNAAGFVRSRTDHQAFGEEIASGVGLRTPAQGFGAPATNRQGYGLTEKDAATGLNHTWFRKNENRAGRWTSPDPYNGSASVGNPQSWNRYSYVESQPTNFVDPSGLQIVVTCEIWTWYHRVYNPDGTIKSETEIGPRYLVCTVTGAGPRHEVTLPSLGGTNSNQDNDPNLDRISELAKCMANKLQSIEEKFHETIGDLDIDFQENVAVTVGGGAVGTIGLIAAGGAVATTVATGGSVTVTVGALHVLFDHRRRDRAGRIASRATNEAYVECLGEVGLKERNRIFLNR